MKEEASDYLQPDTIRALVKKYSQFINFPIYLWASRTETVEEPDEADADADEDEDAQVRSHYISFITSQHRCSDGRSFLSMLFLILVIFFLFSLLPCL